MDSDNESLMSKASTSSRASTGVKRPKKKKKSEDPAVAQLREQLEEEREDFQNQLEDLRTKLKEAVQNGLQNLIQKHEIETKLLTADSNLRDKETNIRSLQNTKINQEIQMERIQHENNQLKLRLAATEKPDTPSAIKPAATEKPDTTSLAKLEATITQLNIKITSLLAENNQLRKDLAASQAEREQPAAPSQTAPMPGASATTRKRLRDQVPSVVIHKPEEWTVVQKKISSKNIKVKNAKLTRDGIAITPESPDDHRLLTRQLTETKTTYHTYALEDEKLLRAVFRGLPLCIDAEDITTDLQEKGFNPVKVSRMIHPKTKQPMPLVLVQVPPTEVSILEVRNCCQLSIRVEKQKPRTQLGQCHNCQSFGHAQKRCTAPPKCVKCGGDHPSRSCEKPREEPARCLRCSGPHPASYRGCPKAPRKTPRPTPAKTGAPAAPVRQVSPYRNPRISYAEAARPKQADVPVGPPQQLSTAANWQPAHPQQWGSLREQFEAMKNLFDNFFSMFQIPTTEAMDQDITHTTTTQLS